MKTILLALILLFPSAAFAGKPSNAGDRLVATVVMTLMVAGIGWFVSFIRNRKK